MISVTSTAGASGCMTRNVRRQRAPFHPQPRRLGKIRIAAQALGCSEALAHKKLYGDHAVAVETGKLIVAALGAKDREMYARVMQPIDAAHLSQELRHHEEIELECDELDAIEDVAQSAWRRTRSDAALEEYISKMGLSVYKETEYLASLKAELKRRREEKAHA